MDCHFEVIEFNNCGRCYLPSYFSIKIGVPSEQSWTTKIERKFIFSLLPPESPNSFFSGGQLLTKRYIESKKYVTDYQWYRYLWKLYRMYGKKDTYFTGPVFSWINPSYGTTINPFDNRVSVTKARKIIITSPGILEGWVVPMVINWLKEYPDPRYYLSERMHMAKLLDSLYEDD